LQLMQKEKSNLVNNPTWAIHVEVGEAWIPINLKKEEIMNQKESNFFKLLLTYETMFLIYDFL
jgi:hypothetical protein